jgi:hypothetical protein
VSIPDNVRESLRDQLWAEADTIGWSTLSGPDKSRRYDDWVVREDVGGKLGRHMDARAVRVYLKDTVMKGYALRRLESHERPFRVLGVELEAEVVEDYVKPHGRRLADGRIISWGSASNWKAILMAQFERCRHRNCTSGGIVLSGASGRYQSAAFRALVEDAAGLLGTGRIAWLEM